jgi:hypothetical protein
MGKTFLYEMGLEFSHLFTDQSINTHGIYSFYKSSLTFLVRATFEI